MIFLYKLLDNSVVFNRLIKGVGANVLGKIWVILIQFSSIYFLNKAWGVAGYGIWLMISSIPIYLAISDFGLGTAATIRMTKALASNDPKDALQSFQSVWVFVTGLTFIIFTVSLLCGWLWGYLSGLHQTIGGVSYLLILQTISVMGLTTLLTIQMSLLKSVFQANNKYAVGTIFFDVASLFEGVIVIIVAVLGGNILYAAIGMLVVRLIFLNIYHLLIYRYENWFTFGYIFADIKTLKELLNPSLAAFALTLANSFGIQGIVLTIGWTLGPAAAAIFSSTRMLTRISLQIPSLLMRASIPELTRAYTQKDSELVKKLMSINIRLTLLVVVPASVILSVIGPWLLSTISYTSIKVNHIEFVLLGGAAVFCSLWNTLGMQLLSINKQSEFSWFVMFIYFICCMVPLFFYEYQTILGLLCLLELVIFIFLFFKIEKMKRANF